MEEPRWSGARYRRHMTGATALMLAAKSADVEVMRLLLDHGADATINTEDNITPLMAAAGISWASNQDRASEEQVLDAVRLLVEEGGLDVNAVSDVGETAMHAAAYRGANSVVQYLFEPGRTTSTSWRWTVGPRCASPTAWSMATRSPPTPTPRCCSGSSARATSRMPGALRGGHPGGGVRKMTGPAA